MRIISSVNGKGGVGKTTTICGLALYAAARGHSVLTIDFDDQGSLTSALLGDDHPLTSDQYDLLTDDSSKLSDVLTHPRKNIDLLPASFSLHKLDYLNDPFLLRKAFDRWSLNYDLVLIDTPGHASSPRLSMALCASTAYYVPLELRRYAMQSLQATLSVCHRASGTYYNPRLFELGFVLCKVDQISKSGPSRGLPVLSNQRTLYKELKDTYGAESILGVIGRREPINDAFSKGMLLQELPQNENTRDAIAEIGAFVDRVLERAQVARVAQ